ncbi:helix-turn-helix domain-containing protein [Dactylosporangium sp. CA-233914]|uniref:helix-turn-helix domain-containing protein n=1 Tax=Dactylosporangium sp. CA-233914 TaxID=3239934 RepID=UPI003D937CA8
MESVAELRLSTLDSSSPPAAEPGRGGEPMLCLVIQVSGTGILRQRGREAVLSPGDFALCDMTAPYTLRRPGGSIQHIVQIPLAMLGPARPLLAAATARTFPAHGDPTGELVTGYFTRLISQPELRHGLHAATVAEVGVRLLTALLTSQCAGAAQACEPSTLASSILAYLRERFADPDLCAAQVARAHNISVRYLYVLLGREGITLGEWLRSRRLAAARDELAGRHADRRTIAAVANRWGFADATHFSKVFRETYGMTPRTWRALHQRPAG